MPEPTNAQPKKEPKLLRGSCVLWLVGVSAAIVLLSKLVGIVFPPPDVPLFEPAPDVHVFADPADAEARVGRTLPLPAETTGAAFHAAAWYPTDSPVFPAGTLHAVYAKDDRRLFDVVELPGTDASFYDRYAPGVPGPDAAVGTSVGRVVNLGLRHPVCIDATDTRPLRLCQITKRFVFERNGRVVIIAADGNALTDGELLVIARSIPQ